MEPALGKKEKRSYHKVVRCPQCGTDNLEVQFSCGRCGYNFRKPLKEFGYKFGGPDQPSIGGGAKILCPNCGAGNDILAHFCHKCGLALKK